MSLGILIANGMALLLSQERLYACAVCFGQNDNPNLAKAYTWGIFVLMAFTMLILGAFTYAVFRMERQSKLARGKSA